MVYNKRLIVEKFNISVLLVCNDIVPQWAVRAFLLKIDIFVVYHAIFEI